MSTYHVYIQSAISADSASPESTNQSRNIQGKKFQKAKFEFATCNSLHNIYNSIYNYLHSIYIILGIISNLEMI